MTRNPLTDGETVLASLWGSMMNAHGAEAVLNGIAPSVGTGNWDVDTTAGDVFINGTTASVGADTTTLTDPASDADLDSGEFRVDLLTVNSAGAINVAEGTAAALPISPDIPTDEAVICAVVVSGDASSLQSGDIRNYRTLLEDDSARYIDGGPHEIDAAEFAGADGTAGQFLKSDGSAANWETVVFPDTAFQFFSDAEGTPEGSNDTVFDENVSFARLNSYNFTAINDGVFATTTQKTTNNDGTDGPELRLRDITNSNTVAQVSTTSDTAVRLTDSSPSIPSGTATVILEVRCQNGNENITTYQAGFTMQT